MWPQLFHWPDTTKPCSVEGYRESVIDRRAYDELDSRPWGTGFFGNVTTVLRQSVIVGGDTGPILVPWHHPLTSH